MLLRLCCENLVKMLYNFQYYYCCHLSVALVPTLIKRCNDIRMLGSEYSVLQFFVFCSVSFSAHSIRNMIRILKRKFKNILRLHNNLHNCWIATLDPAQKAAFPWVVCFQPFAVAVCPYRIFFLFTHCGIWSPYFVFVNALLDNIDLVLSASSVADSNTLSLVALNKGLLIPFNLQCFWQSERCGSETWKATQIKTTSKRRWFRYVSSER